MHSYIYADRFLRALANVLILVLMEDALVLQGTLATAGDFDEMS